MAVRGISSAVRGVFAGGTRAGEIVGGISKAQVRAITRQPLSNVRTSRTASQFSRNARPWVLFDLDETLTYINEGKAGALPAAFSRGEAPRIRDWIPWERHLARDIPEPEMSALFRQYRETHNVGILTARSERSRPITERWLKTHGLEPDLLMLRPITKELENMSSGPYKTQMIDTFLPGAQIDRFYDDSKGVIDAMQERGIEAVHVTPKKHPTLPSGRLAKRRRKLPSRIQNLRKTQDIYGF